MNININIKIPIITNYKLQIDTYTNNHETPPLSPSPLYLVLIFFLEKSNLMSRADVMADDR